MLTRIAEGSWLTSERIRVAAVLCGAISIATLAFLYMTANGTIDLYGRPLGTDFSNVWTAGRMALGGSASAAWDWPSHYAVQQEAHRSSSVPFYGWHYPPPFLLVASLLAFMPYTMALLVWQAVTLSAALLLLRRIVPAPTTMLLGFTAPVVFVCIGHGHNGFLTAALLAGGLWLLERRPLLAGALLGCLIYKPQFALLIPPLLLVAGNWRAIAGATLSGGFLVGATLLLWGWPVWEAFADSLPLTRKVVIEAGATGWEKIHSPFAMVRMWGGDLPAAYALQAIATISSISAVLWLTRTASTSQRNAAATAAALLSTPYVLDYDYVVLGFGAAFLAADGFKRGFLSYEKSLLAIVWLAPFFARQSAALLLLPVGQATAVAILALAVRRAIVFDGALPQGLRSLPSRRSRGASAR
jgi:hypothetical protein